MVFWALCSRPSLSSQCLWHHHAARGTGPSPTPSSPHYPSSPVEQHFAHSSSLSTPSIPNPELQGQFPLYHLPLSLLPHLSTCEPPLRTGLALPNPPQSPPIPDPTIALPFSVLYGRWREPMAVPPNSVSSYSPTRVRTSRIEPRAWNNVQNRHTQRDLDHLP